MAAHQQHAVLSCEAKMVAMMRQFPQSASVQRWGACAMVRRVQRLPMARLTIVHNLGRAGACVHNLGRAGACEAIVAALLAHRLNVRVQEAALAAAGTLVCGSRSNWLKLKAAGLCPLVVAAMRAHAAQSGVQQYAAGVIAEIAEATRSFDVATASRAAHSSEHAATKEALMAAGVNTALVRALQTHCGSHKMVWRILYALISLTSAFTRRDALKFCSAGGANTLVAVMNAHPFHGYVQQAAARVLIQLAGTGGTDAIANKFIAAGASAAVTAVFHNVPQFASLDAVACLARYDAAVQLAAAGAAEAVLAAVRTHTDDILFKVSLSTSELTSALYALSVLAGNETVCTRLRAAGACEAVAIVLRSIELPEIWPGPNARVHMYALSLVRSLAKNSMCSTGAPEGLARLAHARACEAVVTILRQLLQQPHGEELLTHTIDQAICAMETLSNDSGLAARLALAGAKSAVASAIATYPANNYFQAACKCLKYHLSSTAASRSDRYY
ncbi:hypothetical protein JKP88DRAFT_249946 [Tribonema minus]|uniref:Uncharacterized protein n=1 Tax=Tribonema minus TaxID=303371 RepID=A0A836C8J6_9STRA|nr:hypothetical protein JKP88DRAFT_249946 [Tribonema minus]